MHEYTSRDSAAASERQEPYSPRGGVDTDACAGTNARTGRKIKVRREWRLRRSCALVDSL